MYHLYVYIDHIYVNIYIYMINTTTYCPSNVRSRNPRSKRRLKGATNSCQLTPFAIDMKRLNMVSPEARKNWWTGWWFQPTPFEKYAQVKMGSFLQGIGVKIKKKIELPPPRVGSKRDPYVMVYES